LEDYPEHGRYDLKETGEMWKLPQIFFSWEGIIACVTYRFASWNVLNLTHCLPCSKIVLNKCKHNAPIGDVIFFLVLEGCLTKNRSQQMVDRLRELQASSPDIEASAVVSVDGLSIASALPQGVEEDRVSAMSAAMLSLGERISSELGRGSLEQVYIKGLKGYVVLMSVGQEAVLTALAREQAKLGLIFLDMRRAAEDLAKLI
jgi:predicted regulator of Ras-like GTPase activity (Roadblock/LC7/MglB family)